MTRSCLRPGVPYREALETRRTDVGAVGQMLLRERFLVSARGAVSQLARPSVWRDPGARSSRHRPLARSPLRTTTGRHTLVAGVALERDAYHPRDVPQFAYDYLVPGVFGQADVEITKWFSLSGSGRLDHHSEYGTFFSPRVAALFRSGQWNSRLSVGTGFFGPSPLTEETEAAGLTRLVIPARLRAEEGRSASIDVSRTHGPLSYTVTLFGVPHRPSDQRGPLHRTCDHQSLGAGVEPGLELARHIATGALCADGDLHVRPIAGN